MVKRCVALVLAATGCLGKPPVPATGDGGTDGAGDAGGCATSLPTGLQLRKIAKVANVDAVAGSTTDDFLVLGREPGQQGVVYLVHGSASLDLACAARRFTFDGLTVEPLDATFADVNRDGHLDLLMFGRDDGVAADFQVHYYEGQSDGRFEGMPQIIKITKAFLADEDLGRSIADPEPAYIEAWTSTTTSEVVVGGLYPPAATLFYDGVSPLLPTSPGTFDTTMFPMDYVQNVAVDPTNPIRLLFVTQGRAQVFERQSPASIASTFVRIGDAALTSTVPRSAKLARRAVLGEALAVTLDPLGFDLVGIDSQGAPRVAHLARTLPPSFVVEDLAFGDLDGNTTIDLLALYRTNGSPQLDVFLDVSPNFGTGVVTFASHLTRMLGAGSGILAVGDFDGQASSPDQILALTTVVDGGLGACYHVVAGSPSACIVACGETSCP